MTGPHQIDSFPMPLFLSFACVEFSLVHGWSGAIGQLGAHALRSIECACSRSHLCCDVCIVCEYSQGGRVRSCQVENAGCDISIPSAVSRSGSSNLCFSGNCALLKTNYDQFPIGYPGAQSSRREEVATVLTCTINPSVCQQCGESEEEEKEESGMAGICISSNNRRLCSEKW